MPLTIAFGSRTVNVADPPRVEVVMPYLAGCVYESNTFPDPLAGDGYLPGFLALLGTNNPSSLWPSMLHLWY